MDLIQHRLIAFTGQLLEPVRHVTHLAHGVVPIKALEFTLRKGLELLLRLGDLGLGLGLVLLGSLLFGGLGCLGGGLLGGELGCAGTGALDLLLRG